MERAPDCSIILRVSANPLGSSELKSITGIQNWSGAAQFSYCAQSLSERSARKRLAWCKLPGGSQSGPKAETIQQFIIMLFHDSSEPPLLRVNTGRGD